MPQKKAGKKESTQKSVENFNRKIEAFDKAMNQVRRDYIQKSTNSKKSASELVLTS